MTDFIQVFITAQSREEAQRIAEALVKNRLAACSQVLGPIQSTYWWQGQVEGSQEWMCLAKSLRERFEKLVHLVQKLHSYEVPEIIALPLVAVSDSYGRWLKAELNQTP